ncbi:MAG: CAP domain-containing protein [Polyangiales bacterium]
MRNSTLSPRGVLMVCASIAALAACGDPPPVAPGMDASSTGRDASIAPRDDGGFMVLPDASTMNPPPGSTCERVCQHIYGDCMFAFRTSSGQTVSQAACVQGCSMGALNGAESCLESVACTQAAVSACLQRVMPPPMGDAGSPPPPPADSGAPAGNASLEDQVLVIVNQRRAMGANCGGTMYGPTTPLVMNEQLRAAARGHSLDMGTRNFFDHNSPEGTTPFQRIAAAGYTGSPQGENIAAGNATAAATMTQWMNSPGHCQNIMNPQYRSIGVGYANVAGSRYTHYWTQTFGGR